MFDFLGFLEGQFLKMHQKKEHIQTKNPTQTLFSLVPKNEWRKLKENLTCGWNVWKKWVLT